MNHVQKLLRLSRANMEIGSVLSDRELRLAILADEAMELARSLNQEIRALRAEMDEDETKPSRRGLLTTEQRATF